MAVDALLERSQFHDGVEVERFWLLYIAVDLKRPWARLESAGEFCWAILIGGEFVVIVVVRDVLKRRELFVGAELALAVLQLARCGCLSRLIWRKHFEGPGPGERERSGGSSADDEIATIEIKALGSDLRRADVGQFLGHESPQQEYALIT
jgi:hypothetical protein